MEPEEARRPDPERNGTASNGVASTDASASSHASDAEPHRADYLYRIIHPQVACTDSHGMRSCSSHLPVKLSSYDTVFYSYVLVH